MLFPPQTLWLQDPRFDGLAPLETLGRYRDREAIARRVLAAHRPGLANVHLLLRQTFTLDALPRAARLRLSRDVPVVTAGVRHSKLTRVGLGAWTIECQTSKQRNN